MITPDQIRAARALKGWSQGDLAARTGLAVPTIANIEISKQEPSVKTMDKIVKAFNFSGIRFTETGVEKSSDTITHLRGYYEYYNILDDAASILSKGDEFLMLGADAKRSPKSVIDAQDRLMDKGITVRNIICEGNIFIQEKPECIRWIPKKYFTFNDVITIYANKVVTTLPQGRSKDDDIIQIVENESIAENHKKIFEFFWDNANPLTTWVDARDYKNPILENYTAAEIEKITKDHLKSKKAGK